VLERAAGTASKPDADDADAFRRSERRKADRIAGPEERNGWRTHRRREMERAAVRRHDETSAPVNRGERTEREPAGQVRGWRTVRDLGREPLLGFGSSDERPRPPARTELGRHATPAPCWPVLERPA